MPRKYSKKKTRSRRKRPRRRRKRRFTLSRLPVNGFPTKFMCKHRYHQNISCPATSSLNDVFSHSFNLSSTYDPDADSGGHQPRGRDALAAVYDRYCVVGAKITVRPIYPSVLPGSGLTSLAYGIAVSQTSNLYETYGFTDMMEQWSYRKYRLASNDAARSRSVSRTYSLKKFLKHPKPLSDDVVSAAPGQNPSKGAFGILWACNPAGSARSGPVTFSVIIEQTVVWFRKTQQPLS